MDDNEYVIKIFGYVAIVVMVLLYIPFVWLLDGWALAKLWRWFVVPYFSLRPLTLGEAVGLGMIVGFLTFRSDLMTKEFRSVPDKITAFLLPVLHALIAVGSGWIVHRWM